MKLYEQVQKQIKDAYSFIKDEYDANLLEKFLYPDRVMEFYIPVKMDDGKTKVFIGYRSQHNNSKGPYKGGIRFHQNVSKDEVMSLSAWMSLKTGVVGLPLGGGKGGVIVNPKELSIGELERLSRGFMQKLAPFIGNQVDIPAPDVNTTPQIMAWMAEEYSKLTGTRTPGVITGKPLSIGGSEGRGAATAQGGFYVLEQYLADKNDSISGKSVVIQGSGNAGLTFAQIASKAGAKIIAISDSKGAIYNENGLNINDITLLKNKKKSVTEYGDGKVITNEDLLFLNTEILVPAALENQITKDNADQINAKLILELANGPTTYEADTILQKKGVDVLPDILANSGGVTVSYFEQVQNNMNYYRKEDEVNKKLEDIIKPATKEVVSLAEKYNTNLRNGAYISSLRIILESMKTRG
ncbi:MAG TPA: Glu/Leu/Phe/Val dehydrogenase [Candidatus Absconditabacterales bacterium]|nr:Glu/Leu/Phe/Val dehydrogenase [Candidatus Absconditabacterales bacterium]